MNDRHNDLYAAIAARIEQLQGADVSDDVIETVLSTTTNGVVATVPGAAYSSLTLVEDGVVVTIASTHEIATRLDELQAKHDIGPCLESAWEQHLVRIDDYTTEERWPLFIGDVVAQTPVRSSVSFQLYRQGSSMGALNVHADHPNAFGDQALDLGKAFAAQAALSLHSRTWQQQFDEALASRDLIGQAKGILMEQFTVDADRAFEILKKLSQDTNVKLVEIARRLVAIDHPSASQ